ncbi:hypothetical protein B0O99DRAFT_511387 [Bisporella sp. PMI_857]|nr:hypothetical protein B0O99DRAFT_511387 [Bisporella sp. PMI_857]
MASMVDTSFHVVSHRMGHDHDGSDFSLYPEPTASMFPQQPFPGNNANQNFEMGENLFAYTRESYTPNTGFESHGLYATAHQYGMESPELRTAPSNYSTASGASATSSNMGSPHSVQNHTVPEWMPSGLGLTPGIVQFDNFAQGNEYTFTSSGMEEYATVEYNGAKPSFSVGECNNITRSPFNPSSFASSTAGRSSDLSSTPLSAISQSSFASESTTFSNYHQTSFFSQSSGNFVAPLESSYPSILYSGRPASATQSHDTSAYQPPTYPTSPLSQQSRSPIPHLKQGSQSPYPNSYSQYPYPGARRPSVISYSSDTFSSEESREKGRCTYPECGKTFKDLKAHMLTHQNERPEKCPIQTCDYHVKGFARKYDKNRHTLTHYKGTMVCGFCPGSGSAAEKSFNRADVFKRHLTSVHAVEQTPPNSRKKTSSTINSGKKLSGYAPDATGKCSTCSSTFNNAQDFYEHLDDCVLRIVQQEEPSEAINAARLAEVEHDSNVHDTLRNNSLPTTTATYSADEDEEDDEMDDSQDESFSLTKSRKGRSNPKNGVQKSRGLTHSKGGVTLHTKSRKRRKDYPSSWGCPTSQMKMKKRVLCVFDGPRRLWKDDMMLDTDYEVRMKLQGNERAYVTDLDVQTLRRADAFHGATDEEKGPWVADDLAGVDLEKLMEVKRES